VKIYRDPGAGCGCLFLSVIAFWVFIYYSVVHFILKYW
jgi:hypothetical protein